MSPIALPVDETIPAIPVVVCDMLILDIATPVVVGSIDMAELICMSIAISLGCAVF